MTALPKCAVMTILRTRPTSQLGAVEDAPRRQRTHQPINECTVIAE